MVFMQVREVPSSAESVASPQFRPIDWQKDWQRRQSAPSEGATTSNP